LIHGVLIEMSPSTTRPSSLRHWTYRLVENPDRDFIPGRIFTLAIMGLILLNVLAVVLETESAFFDPSRGLFYWFEVVSVLVFSVEYLLRLWACVEIPRYRHPVWGRLKFALSPLALVDLAAVLPFYAPMLIRMDLRFVRILRFLRVFRILKLGRYSESIRLVGRVLRAKLEELMVSVFVLFILLIFSSSLVYFFEREAQPVAFRSIPAAMWWGVSTLTTVGYGDVYPVTPLGKLAGGLIAILGIGLFALPAGILAGGFTEVLRQKPPPRLTHCPHCGRELVNHTNDNHHRSENSQ
jgi:voltage-gated potassium channel